MKQSKIQIILHEKGLKNRCRYSKIEKKTSEKGGLFASIVVYADQHCIFAAGALLPLL